VVRRRLVPALEHCMVKFLLALLPSWALLLAAGIAASALAGFVAWQVHIQRDIGRAEVQAQWDVSLSAQRAEALKRSQENAAKIAKILNDQESLQDENNRNAAAAARANAAASSLRAQLAQYVAANSRRADPAATGQQPRVESADPLVLLADLFGRADKRAGDLAQLADALRTAGAGCERYSEIVRP
jgi:Skp family chaperone for outer membrane proteins